MVEISKKFSLQSILQSNIMYIRRFMVLCISNIIVYFLL